VATLLSATAITALLPLQAMAQSAPPAPLIGTPPPVGSPLPGIDRQERAPPTQPSAPPPPAVPGAVSAEKTVHIVAVAPVQGVQAYAADTIERYTFGLVGDAVSVQRIEAARTAIINRYRADGFVYTAVQAHISADHVLHFRVTEGQVVDVKLEGDRAELKDLHAGVLVLRVLRHLVTGHAVNVRDFERYLLLAQDIPGLTVSARLDPSHDDQGALTLVAHVSRQVVSVQLSADNRGFRNTGPEEMLGIFSVNSLTSWGDRTSVSIYHTFNDTDTFGQASEEFFVGSHGVKVRLYGGEGESTPSGELRAVGYDGVTRVFGASAAYPVIRSRSENLTISALFDGVESDITTNTEGHRTTSSYDSLRILRALADYNTSDFYLFNEPAQDFAELRVSEGISALGSRRDTDKLLPRLHEHIEFKKVNGEVDRTQTLVTPFKGAIVNLKTAAEGQYTDDILPPEEKFYLGGPHFNRGFYYGEVTGDSGLATTVEPQLDMGLFDPSSFISGLTDEPAIRQRYVSQPVRAQFYGFYDWGEVWSSEKLDEDHKLRSVGGGVRIYNSAAYDGSQKVELDLEGVSRLTRTPDGSGPHVSPLSSAAFYWQILVTY
jgi:hemolysin activation/secretion protein